MKQPLIAELMNPGARALIEAEIARRQHDKEHPSLLFDKKSPFSDLMKTAVFKTFYGGRGAAKTRTFAEYLIRRAVKEPIVILCTREYQNSIADSVHRVLRGTIHRLGMSASFDITDKSIRSKIGAEFIFKGLHHNIDGIRSTENVRITWVAEAQNTTEESWRVLLPTVLRDGEDCEVLIEFNTTDENSPTHQRFVIHPPKGSIVHKVNYTENPYFPKLLRELMESDRNRDEEVYRHIWLGFPRRMSSAVVLGGRVRVQEFDDVLWKNAERLFFGNDHGFSSDPATLVRCFALTLDKVKKLKLEGHDDKKRQCDRLYIEYEAGGTGIELEELESMFDQVPGSREWPIKADASRPEVISFMRGKGFNISAAEKWAGSVEDGIAHLRSHDIIIHPRCPQTVEEATSNYRYKVDPRVLDPKTNAPQVLPVIVDAHNHYIDATRYSLDGYIQRRGGLAIWENLAKQK